VYGSTVLPLTEETKMTDTVLKIKEGNDRKVTLVKHVTFGFGGHANPPIYTTTVEYLGEEHLNFDVSRNTLKLAKASFATWSEVAK
jgi:hypothetical protein|tara:strand:- start:104 stop:361 length:258 start_codon:yes stop_codon:yes gene_type:complete